MKNELSVKIGTRDVQCILLDGFYMNMPLTGNLHRHNYTEIHILCGESTCFELENRKLCFSGSCVFAIPAGKLHRFFCADGVQHSAFLIEAETEKFLQLDIPKETALSFFDEIKKCKDSENYTKVAAYISLLCSDIIGADALTATPITDTAFIINNFFSVNYSKEATLSDLAAELHYSEKHTERLVRKHTGMTFKQAMIEYRMSVASHLAKTTDMPLSEIAERVGYNSYNGFWQAYRQYQKKD